MNKTRMRTTTILLIAILMISVFAIVIPVSAKGWGKPEILVRAIGQFTTNFDFGSGINHRCFVNLHARQVADGSEGWTGHGVFWDKDYKDGKLVAIFTVESTTVDLLPNQVNYQGTANIYVNDEYIGNYVWESICGSSVFSFQIRGQGLDYYAFVFGEDIGVKFTVKE